MSKKSLDVSDYFKLCNKLTLHSSILNAVVSCIQYHQNHKIALASISLKPTLYKRFVDTVSQINGEGFEEGTPFEICHVPITCGSLFQTRELLPEMWKDFQHNIGERTPNVVNP